MCDEYELFEYLEAEDCVEIRQKRRRTRELFDPFQIDESDFIHQYRLTPDLVHSLCEDLQPIMRTNPIKSTDLSIETKVLTAISVYAHGSYQKPTGRVRDLAQTTVSDVLADVTAALNSLEIRNKYIKFPQTQAERDENKLRFYDKYGIPGVIGCIDTSHIAIVRPKENKESYFCGNKYHSLNVQLICNADMEIISVEASQPGATHDSHIWINHPLRPHLEDLSFTEDIWLLGDSAYPLRKTMMTPILDAVPGSPEAYYTLKHAQTMNIIERTIVTLKARFRCLLAHRMLHYQPHVAASITNACVILHNMCNAANVLVPELTEYEVQREASRQPSTLSYVDASMESRDLEVAGIHTRQELVRQLWHLRKN